MENNETVILEIIIKSHRSNSKLWKQNFLYSQPCFISFFGYNIHLGTE